MTRPIFYSADHFRQLFIERLDQMLQYEEIGVFILVLANALSRRQVYQALAPALQQRFQQLQSQLAPANAEDLASYPKDDVAVFFALQKMGFDNLTLARSRQQGAWQLQFHPLRALRPARNSANAVTRLHQPFNKAAFHFNKPFLRKEVLWQGDITGTAVRLMYNKFPFADFHGLLLIDGENAKPQFLQQSDCLQAQRVFEQFFPHNHFGMAYNSLGAYASVNHQHWQTFLTEQAYTIEHKDWRHNGGDRDYPLQVSRFSNLMQAWPSIDRLQSSNQAFNLFIHHAKVWLIERKRQGEYAHTEWTGGFAWSETAGALMVTRQQDYLSMTTSQIEQEFRKLKI